MARTVEWEVVRVGSVWKVFWHGAWVATANDRSDAESYVEAKKAGRPYSMRRARTPEPSHAK